MYICVYVHVCVCACVRTKTDKDHTDENIDDITNDTSSNDDVKGYWSSPCSVSIIRQYICVSGWLFKYKWLHLLVCHNCEDAYSDWKDIKCPEKTSDCHPCQQLSLVCPSEDVHLPAMMVTTAAIHRVSIARSKGLSKYKSRTTTLSSHHDNISQHRNSH